MNAKLDPRTIAADLMTHAARDLDNLDVLTHIGQAYDVLTYPDSLPTEVLDLVRTAGINLLWPDGTRDTELDAQRVEVERLRAEQVEAATRHLASSNRHLTEIGRLERIIRSLETQLAAQTPEIERLTAALAKVTAERDEADEIAEGLREQIADIRAEGE